MQHMNYCRQMVKQFTAAIANPAHPFKDILSHVIDLAKVSQKFLLPDGGRLYDDPEYRALDEQQPLNLPYKNIAIEYSRKKSVVNEHGEVSTKTILLARQSDDFIIVTPIIWSDKHGLWGPMPEAAIPRVGYLNRSNIIDGRTPFLIQLANDALPFSDYADECGALLCFLNVLQCKNVHTECSEPRKMTKAARCRIDAIPFDAYHILTIDTPHTKSNVGCHDSSHRSPREHLRRGHIRRLNDGRKIWVNATVVAAGKGAGVINKDYLLRGPLNSINGQEFMVPRSATTVIPNSALSGNGGGTYIIDARGADHEGMARLEKMIRQSVSR